MRLYIHNVYENRFCVDQDSWQKISGVTWSFALCAVIYTNCRSSAVTAHWPTRTASNQAASAHVVIVPDRSTLGWCDVAERI